MSAPLFAIKLGPLNCFCVKQTAADLSAYELRNDDAPEQAQQKLLLPGVTNLPPTAGRAAPGGLGGLDVGAAQTADDELLGRELSAQGQIPQVQASATASSAVPLAGAAGAAAVAAAAGGGVGISDGVPSFGGPEARLGAGGPAPSGFKEASASSIPAAPAQGAPAGPPCAPLDILNVMVEKLWPSIDRAIYKAVQQTVMPIIRDIIGVPFIGRRLKILTFSLGHNPARLGPLELYKVPIEGGGGKGVRALEIRIGVDLDCDADISFGFGKTLSLGIEGIALQGTFVVRLSPLLPMIPVVGAVSVYFLDPPVINIKFAGIGKLAEVPKISDIVRQAIDTAIAQSLVMPNTIPTPLLGEEQGVDRKELTVNPLGVVIITAVRAEKLVPSKGELKRTMLAAHVCDPYVMISCSDDVWKSSTVEKKLNPVWTKDDSHGFFVYDMDQRVRIEVWDDDPLHDDLVGHRHLPIIEVIKLKEEGIRLERPGLSKSAGTLFLDCQWCSLVPDNLGEGSDIIVHVKFDEAVVPAIYFKDPGSESVAIRVSINNIGTRLRGKKKVEKIEKTTAFVTVFDQMQALTQTAAALFEMAERAEGQKLDPKTVSAITGLSAEMLKNHALDKEAEALLAEEATRVFSIESSLSMAIPREAVDEAEIVLSIVDQDLGAIGSFNLPLASIRKELRWMGPDNGQATFTSAKKSYRRRVRSEQIKVGVEISVEGLQPSNPAKSRAVALANCTPPQRPKSSPLLRPTLGYEQCATREPIAISSQADDKLINDLVAQLWPIVDKAIRKMFEEQILETIKQSLPSLLKGITIEDFTLGTTLPEIGPVKVYSGPKGTGELELRVGVRFQSDDLSISLGMVRGFAPVGVCGIHFEGELIVRIQPILDMVPVLGGFVIFFLDPPSLRLKFSGLAKVAEIVRIKGLVRTAINSAIADILVLPHVIAVPLVFDENIVDLKRLQSPKPRGILRVTVQSASGLKGMDWGPTKSTSDPYVVILLGADRLQTDVVKKTCDPVWAENNTRDFLVYDEAQKLLIEVYDYDFFTPDDVIASVLPCMSVAQAVSYSEESKPFPLQVTDMLGQMPELPTAKQPPGGSLYMQCQWMQLMPGRVGHEGLIVLVEVDEVHLPLLLGTAAALCVELGGQRKVTPTAYPPTGCVAKAVEDELLSACERCKANNLDVNTAVEVTSLDAEKVRAKYGMQGEMSKEQKDESEKRVKRLATNTLHIESALYMTVQTDLGHDPDLEIHLSLVDPKGQRLVGTSLTIGELLQQPSLRKPIRFMSSEEFSRVKVEVDVTGVGLQYAELTAP